MLDKKWLLKNKELFEESCRKRNINSNFDHFKGLDDKAKSIISLQEKKRALQKQIKGQTEEAIALKQELISLDKQKEQSLKALKEWLSVQPNVLQENVPYGQDEADNEVVFESPRASKETKPHYDVLQNLILKEQASKLSGARFVVFKKALSKLQNALVDFMKEENAKNGYEEYTVPSLVNEECLFGTSQLPKFADDAFKTTNGKWLISTGEIALVNLFREHIFASDDLPKLCMTFSACFRQEAGASGCDTKGLIRLHQFHKVELVTICKLEEANLLHEKKLEAAKNILDKLKIPYRVLLLCGADTGFSATKQYDIEMWMCGMQRWLEVASCSQCGTFQGLRANIRYKDDNGKLQHAHTLNGSALPIERLIAGIIEHYLVEDGILIPEVLRARMDAKQKIKLDGEIV